MYFKSKKVSLLILAITALVFSRTMFVFFNDAEGPNLLVVVVTAAVIYFPALAVYLRKPRLLAAALAQILIAAVLYLFLK
ncbi:MAG TPA: hypothetical protein VHE10_01155 [Candidatus Paceibacterota bacterium]|nr:hypothetical protein [Candidatus Paceibacterota bacterium]